MGFRFSNTREESADAGEGLISFQHRLDDAFKAANSAMESDRKCLLKRFLELESPAVANIFDVTTYEQKPESDSGSEGDRKDPEDQAYMKSDSAHDDALPDSFLEDQLAQQSEATVMPDVDDESSGICSVCHPWGGL